MMKFVEDIYADFLYDCHIANKRLTAENWEYYGKEEHHIEVPNCEGGDLGPLNSQDLTTYQHWIAGVLQSEIWGRKCFACIPKGFLPTLFETLRIKWDAAQLKKEHQVKAGKCVPLEHLRSIGKVGGSKNKGKPGRKRTREEKESCRRMGLRKPSPETIQKMRDNCFRVDGWIWITNDVEETMVPPEFVLPPEWRVGRKPPSEETRRKHSERMAGNNNPMYGVSPKTKQMRWYKNLEQVIEKMFVPGEEPVGWVQGRLTALDRR